MFVKPKGWATNIEKWQDEKKSVPFISMLNQHSHLLHQPAFPTSSCFCFYFKYLLKAHRILS